MDSALRLTGAGLVLQPRVSGLASRFAVRVCAAGASWVAVGAGCGKGGDPKV